MQHRGFVSRFLALYKYMSVRMCICSIYIRASYILNLPLYFTFSLYAFTDDSVRGIHLALEEIAANIYSR